MINTIDSLDVDRSVLLIGICSTNKYLYHFSKPESTAEAVKVFGDCETTEAYRLLKEMDIDDVYIYNIETQHDLLNSSIDIAQYDFTYILPIGIYISDGFYDASNNGKLTYYVQYMLDHIDKTNCETKIIMTDKSAELYENIDAFLNDMVNINSSLKAKKKVNSDFSHILYVLNNLTGTTVANAYVAGALLYSDINEYPTYNNFPYAVFDIDYTDNIQDMIYFRNHPNTSVTIENLLNLDTYTSPIKIEFVSRILNHIKRNMDFTEFLGKFYTEYSKMNIQKKAESYLDSLINYVIVDYEIVNVYPKQNAPGVVDVYVEMTIQTINCMERVKLVIKVNE